MNKKKDKWYLPDEFKSEYWKGRGITQIVIGIGVTICGFLHKQGIGSVIFIIGGIAWTIFGIFLVARDSKSEQKDEQQSNKVERDKDDTGIDDEENEDDEELKALREESQKLADKINKLEQKTKKKGKK